MKVLPVCSDSMGVRSMALFIETPDVGVFIDPSAALGPRRYGLPPKPPEIRALEEFKAKIRGLAEKADVIVITHYHYDHYDPHEGFYEGKTLLIKDPAVSINSSQRARARAFLESVRDVADEIEVADGKEFVFGGTHIAFSPPVPHGDKGTRLGYVTMVAVESGGRRVLHTSDVDGPVEESTAELIISFSPDEVFIDGPATYFLGYRFSIENLRRAERNLLRIAESVEGIVVDHHLLRDLRYREMLPSLYGSYDVQTFAEYLGVEVNMLEAHRRDL